MEQTSYPDHKLLGSDLLNRKYKETDLLDYRQTVEEVKRLSNLYWTDLLNPNKFNFDFKNSDLPVIFEFIKSLSYSKDPKGLEHVSRPEITLELANNTDYPFDCDDRTVMTRCVLILKNFLITGKANAEKPFKTKIVVSGRLLKPHHIYTCFDIEGKCFEHPFDPTYTKNEYGKTLFKEGYREVF